MRNLMFLLCALSASTSPIFSVNAEDASSPPAIATSEAAGAKAFLGSWKNDQGTLKISENADGIYYVSATISYAVAIEKGSVMKTCEFEGLLRMTPDGKAFFEKDGGALQFTLNSEQTELVARVVEGDAKVFCLYGMTPAGTYQKVDALTTTKEVAKSAVEKTKTAVVAAANAVKKSAKKAVDYIQEKTSPKSDLEQKVDDAYDALKKYWESVEDKTVDAKNYLQKLAEEQAAWVKEKTSEVEQKYSEARKARLEQKIADLETRLQELQSKAAATPGT